MVHSGIILIPEFCTGCRSEAPKALIDAWCKIQVIILILFLSGCMSIPPKKVRPMHYSEGPACADLILEECKGVSEKDRLLCYMEGGVTLYNQEAYTDSTEILLKASQLIEKQDIVNISDQASAVMINDRVMDYKGEYSERLWVHTYLMMNFIMQYKYESALVEAKQALELYDKYPDILEHAYFTRALIALCFENMNLPDDARIEYDKLAKAMGEKNPVSESIDHGKGELILFVEQGSVPGKGYIDTILPSFIRISIPRYADSFPPQSVTIRSDSTVNTPMQITTDLGYVVKKSLNDRAAQYLTRQTLRAGFKEYVAREVRDKIEFAEGLVRAVFFLSEKADTRSWENLPESLTLIRISLDPGSHDLEISSEFSKSVFLSGIDIQEGKRIYRSLRF